MAARNEAAKRPKQRDRHARRWWARDDRDRHARRWRVAMTATAGRCPPRNDVKAAYSVIATLALASGSNLSFPSWHQIIAEVAPVWIQSFDQFDLLGPRSSLYLFLSCDCRTDIRGSVVPDKPDDIIAGRETVRNRVVSMLPYPPWQVGGHACIKHRARWVGHDVDGAGLGIHGKSITWKERDRHARRGRARDDSHGWLLPASR